MVVSYENVSEMLGEIGERLDVAEIAGFEEDQSWMVAIDDETGESLSLDYDAPTGKLFIAANLGPTPENKLLATYEYLLSYNLAWAETDGVRMALDSAEGDILQIHDVTMHDLTADKLGTVLENFLVLMRAMKTVLAEGIGGPSKDGDKTPPPAPSSMMRA